MFGRLSVRQVERAQHGDHVVCGAAQLAPRLPGLRHASPAPATRPRSPLRVAQHARDPRDRGRRRIVGDEMAHQLAARGGGGWRDAWPRKAAPRRRPPRRRGTVGPSASCSPGSCARGRNRKPGGSSLQVDRPAGQDLGELGDVGLGVAGGGADACAAPGTRAPGSRSARLCRRSPARAVGPDRLGVVEIDQHRRVAHHRQQHVVEAAGHVRADRLAHEGAGHRRACRPAELTVKWLAQNHTSRSRNGAGVVSTMSNAASESAPEHVADRRALARAPLFRRGLAESPRARRRRCGRARRARDRAPSSCAAASAAGSGGTGSAPRRPRPKRISACAVCVSMAGILAGATVDGRRYRSVHCPAEHVSRMHAARVHHDHPCKSAPRKGM